MRLDSILHRIDSRSITEWKIHTRLLLPIWWVPLDTQDNHSWESCHFLLCNSPGRYLILHMEKLVFRNVKLRAHDHIGRNQQGRNQTQECLTPNPTIFPPCNTATVSSYWVRWGVRLVSKFKMLSLLKCQRLSPRREASRLSYKMSPKQVFFTLGNFPGSWVWHLMLGCNNLKRDSPLSGDTWTKHRTLTYKNLNVDSFIHGMRWLTSRPKNSNSMELVHPHLPGRLPEEPNHNIWKFLESPESEQREFDNPVLKASSWDSLLFPSHKRRGLAHGTRDISSMWAPWSAPMEPELFRTLLWLPVPYDGPCHHLPLALFAFSVNQSFLGWTHPFFMVRHSSGDMEACPPGNCALLQLTLHIFSVIQCVTPQLYSHGAGLISFISKSGKANA